jgi:hypothetical protein
VAGVNLPDKLRRGLGQGKAVPWESIADRMREFDSDKDDALTKQELAEFLNKSGAGGTWFSKVVADTCWRALESNFSEPITWIKIPVLAYWTSEFMKLPPRKAKRIRITPEGAQGYEPLEYLDGTAVETLAQAMNPGAPQPVTPGQLPAAQVFKHAPEPFTRPPERPRAQPSAAPRGGAVPPPRPATGGASAGGRPAPRAAAPRRPGPRK